MTRLQLRRGIAKARLAFASDSLVFFIAYLAIASGLPILIDPSLFAPASMQMNMSEWLIRFWGLDLAAGGILCGYGLLSERPLIERAGLACLFSGAIIFAAVILIYAGWAALLPSLTYILLAMSAIARYRKLGMIQRGIDLAHHYRYVGKQRDQTSTK